MIYAFGDIFGFTIVGFRTNNEEIPWIDILFIDPDFSIVESGIGFIITCSNIKKTCDTLTFMYNYSKHVNNL